MIFDLESHKKFLLSIKPFQITKKETHIRAADNGSYPYMGFDRWFLVISAVLAIPYARDTVKPSESFISGEDILAFESEDRPV